MELRTLGSSNLSISLVGLGGLELLAWLLHQPGVTAAIAGSGKGRHVRENAEAANLDLTGALGELEPLIPLGPTFATF